MKIVRGIIKVIFSGLLSIIILSVILCAYYILPIHVENKKGNTDYVWPANSVWVKLTEGISWGRFDANGYNNLAVVENPDIIILGSSHMEATDVFQDQATFYLLGKKLEPKYSVYNMGISAHHLFKVCQSLQENINLYDIPPKVIVIETSSITVTQKKVNQVIQKSVNFDQSYSTGIIALLQKVPFLRCVYQQVTLGLLDLFMPTPKNSADSSLQENKSAQNDTVTAKPLTTNDAAYDALFSYLSKIEKDNNVQIIIFFHPSSIFNEDGTIDYESSAERAPFKQYSQQYGITFLDMTEAFEAMYYNEHHVAHGFITGELGTGHLNAYGHEAIANCLYNEIIKLEEAGEICR